MKKYLLLSAVFVFGLIFNESRAQNRAITGKVTSATDGSTMPGVNVVLKGTTNGTITDVDGKYTLSVPSEDGSLVFSFVGMTTEEIAIGSRSVIDVVLSEDAEQLEEVVISALGFKEKRDNMSSTYSKIDADKVLQRGENKVIDGIGGKMSGVRISGTTGDPGGGANIQIRGQSTISGETQPLIIVDGVPLNNDYIRGGASGADSDAGVSQQSRLNDINPDDIASFQVFKGASAGALYGSRGINGVIVITTKRGQAGKAKVTYSSGLTVDKISRRHALQSNFGQGNNGGTWSRDAQRSWGDKIADRTGGADDVDDTGEYFVSDTGGEILYPIIGKNSKETYLDSNFDQVFRTAISWDHKLSLSGGNENTNYYFSVGRADQQGIIRNADYEKTNLTVALTQKLTDRLKMDVKSNFITSSSNRMQTGSNTAGVYLGLLRTSPDFDITHYIGDHVSGGGVVTPGRQRSYRRSRANSDNAIYNNPNWTLNEQINTAEVSRFIGSAEFTYSINDNIKLISRSGADYYTDSRIYFFPYYTAGADRRYGLLEDEVINNKEYNTDLLANFNYDITSDISNSTTIGYGLNSRFRKRNLITADNFIANFRDPLDPSEISAQQNVSSSVGRTNRRYTRLYGTTNFDFKEMILLTLGGSFENHSSLADPFFYPSVELGWIFNKSFSLPEWLSFGKARFTYGQVGNAPGAHAEQTVYEVGSFSSFSDGISLADWGGGYQLNENLGNANLKPEVKTEIEYGLDLRFFQNRFKISATRYTNEIADALLQIGLAPSLGYDGIYANGATIENKGFELETGYQIIDNDTWKASVFANYSKNKNMVTDIPGGSVINFAPGSSVQSVAIEGYPMGVFYTQSFLNDENGKHVLDANGFPQVDVSGNQVVGDPNPDWRGGLGFNAGYKGFNFNILFETSQGNDYSERTKFILQFFGTHESVGNEITLTEDLVNYKGDVFTSGTVVRGNVHDWGAGNVLLDEQYYEALQGFGDGKLNGATVVDGSWTRIREASITYTLKKGLPKTIDNIEIGVSGRNLAIWSDIKGNDPDINQFGVGLGQGIDYFSNPGTRSYTFSIKATF